MLTFIKEYVWQVGSIQLSTRNSLTTYISWEVAKQLEHPFLPESSEQLREAGSSESTISLYCTRAGQLRKDYSDYEPLGFWEQADLQSH